MAKARARALAHHQLLLIDLGGNWCGDCRVLAGTMALPEVKAFVDAHYEVVTVDVGRFDKNLQIPARYGITDRLEGVPSAADRRSQRGTGCSTAATSPRWPTHGTWTRSRWPTGWPVDSSAAA